MLMNQQDYELYYMTWRYYVRKVMGYIVQESDYGPVCIYDLCKDWEGTDLNYKADQLMRIPFEYGYRHIEGVIEALVRFQRVYLRANVGEILKEEAMTRAEFDKWHREIKYKIDDLGRY